MSIPYNSSAFDTHKCTGGIIKYPFRDQGDNITKLYIHKMRGNRSSYAPLANDVLMTAADEKPIGSPFSDDSIAYYVGDDDITDIGDSTIEYNRMFSNIPQSRIDPNGFYAFEFPEMSAQTIEKTSTSESVSYDTSLFKLTFTINLSSSADANEYTIGDFVYVNNASDFTYQSKIGTTVLSSTTTSSISGIISNISGNTVTVIRENFYFIYDATETAYSNFTDNSGTYVLRKTIPGRSEVFQSNSPSILSLRYIKTNNVDLILLNDKFQLINSSGNITNILSSTTAPLTLNEYREMIDNGEYGLNAEPESIRRWRGNIYEISAIKIKPK